MTTFDIKLSLPEPLATEAVRAFLENAGRVAAAGVPALSADEIQAEIEALGKALRRARRRAR